VAPLTDECAESPEVDFQRLMRKRSISLSLLVVVLVVSAFVSVLIGTLGPIGPGKPEYISFGDAMGAIFHGHGHWPDYYVDVFWQVRIPRVVLAALVGAALACAGTAMQAVFRNPMADPYIVGVSSGASLGAVIAGLTGLAGIAFLGWLILPAFAFVTALLTVFAVYFLGSAGGKVNVNTLLLSGIAVAAFIGAVVSSMIYFAGQDYHRIIFWMLGSLSMVSWTAVMIVFFAVIVGTIVVYVFSRDDAYRRRGDDLSSRGVHRRDRLRRPHHPSHGQAGRWGGPPHAGSRCYPKWRNLSDMDGCVVENRHRALGTPCRNHHRTLWRTILPLPSP
jgi:ABC-type Fe3+-siderophore transport system permease subunit